MEDRFLLFNKLLLLIALGLSSHVSGNIDAGEKTKMPGDVNLDGAVNSTDLGIVLNNLGTESGAEWKDGDVTGDGKVDSSDLNAVLSIINKKDNE